MASQQQEHAGSNVQVKQEPVEFVDFESKVIELCKENPKGITDAIIQKSLPNLPPQQRVKGINRLLSTVSEELPQRAHSYFKLFITN